MNFRVLKENEKNKIRELYEEVFDDSQYFVDYYFNSYFKKTINFVCQNDGQIVGMATIHPKKLMVSKKEINVGYVYGVATKLKFRGQGIMKRLLELIDEYASDNNFSYLYLIPANPKIYEGLGYELVRNASERVFIKTNIGAEIENVMVEKIDEDSLGKCVDFIDKNYENRVSIKYDETYLREILARLSINNSGIYCIFDSSCDRIQGLAFIEDDDRLMVDELYCEACDIGLCMRLVMDSLNRKEIIYKINDIMFKNVHKDMEQLKNYSIYINDEV